MKILLADALPAATVARLETAGDDVRVDGSLTAADLGDALAGIEVLVVRSTEVTAEALDRADELALIVRAGAGTNTIDIARAAELGILVCNVPGKNALAVAELAMGLLIAVDRHIAAGTADLRDGKWNKSKYSNGDGLYGRTLGIIGLGDIGIAVAARATAFGIDVIAVEKPDRTADTIERAARAGVRYVGSIDALLSAADIVSLHVPGGSATKHMVDAEFLSKMGDDTILINTCRGDVIDEAALIDAMTNRGIRAGLDVFADEPRSGAADFASPLGQHPSVVATHHVGASTEQAQVAVAEGTVDVIEAYRSGAIVNAVNLESVPQRAARLSVRHEDQVGVLAAVLGILRASELNVSTMSNSVFAGAKAAVATIDVGAVPSPGVLAQINAHEHVINVSVTLA